MKDYKKEELWELIHKVCKEYGGVLISTDTHRWVESDGFYEVQFMIKFPESPDFKECESGIFIHNESGNQKLEDEWSKTNPREVKFEDFEKYMDEDFDIKYAIEQINDFLETKV